MELMAVILDNVELTQDKYQLVSDAINKNIDVRLRPSL